MLTRRTQTATLLRPIEVSDVYGKRVEYKPVKTIQVAVSSVGGSTAVANALLTASSTHLGLTLERDIAERDRLQVQGQVYQIDNVTADGPGRRYTRLNLKLAEPTEVGEL